MEYQIKTHEEKPIPPAAVKHIYQAEKWWPERELDDIAKMLSQNKKQTYGIWDDTRLIGFCRLITDHIFRGYIEDLIIIKEYRNEGAGQFLLKHIIHSNQHIHIISLFCDEQLNPFYESIGFKSYKKQRVFHIKNENRND